MKLLPHSISTPSSRFVFESSSPSAGPTGDIETPEVLAETIGELETVEAAVRGDLEASLNQLLPEERQRGGGVQALLDLLNNEDTMEASAFVEQFNVAWENIPDTVKARITSLAAQGAETQEPVVETAEAEVSATEFVNTNRAELERFFGADELQSMYAGLSSELPEEASIALAMADMLQALEPLLEQAGRVEGLEELLASDEYQGLSLQERAARLQAVAAQNTPEPSVAANPTSGPETAGLDPEIRALVEAVPANMRNMPEYDLWLTALQGGEERRGFVDYTRAEILPSMEEPAKTILGLQLTFFPLMDQVLGMMDGLSLTPPTAEDRENADRAAAEELAAVERDAAIASGLNPDAVTTMQSLAAGNYRIHDLDISTLTAMEAANPGALDTVNSVVATLEGNAQWGTNVLQADLGIGALQSLARLSPEATVVIGSNGSERTIAIDGGEPIVINDEAGTVTAIQTAVQTYIDGEGARQETAAAAAAAEEAAQASAVETDADDGSEESEALVISIPEGETLSDELRARIEQITTDHPNAAPIFSQGLRAETISQLARLVELNGVGADYVTFDDSRLVVNPSGPTNEESITHANLKDRETYLLTAINSSIAELSA